jgi:hypothetical protein
MPENGELAPLDDELRPADIDRQRMGEAARQLLQLMPDALQAMLFQNVPKVEEAARRATAAYAAAAKGGDSTGLLGLKILEQQYCLLVPLARCQRWHVEGQFPRALAETNRGISICAEASDTIEDLAGRPDADHEFAETMHLLFRIYSILLKGMAAWIHSDMVGYQGATPEYLELLRTASAEFRRADELPPSSDETVLALRGTCTRHADSLETRERFFDPGSGSQRWYASPTGSSVFIIHGHAEGKWRELRELLKKEFGVEAVVLKERTDPGETLIDKFEKHADACCYAFALLTPDDFIEKDGKSYFQARPNVLFELGWFYGRFGRDRVCILKKVGTEIPSDLAGIATVNFHDDVDEEVLRIRSVLRGVGLIDSGGDE